MPFVGDILKTKVRGVRTKESQQTLRKIQTAKCQVTELYVNEGDSVVIKVTDEPAINIGKLKEEYKAFIESLVAPDIKYEVTGGYFLIKDEFGNPYTEVKSLWDLSIYEQSMITANRWSYERRFNGMNLEISESE